MKNNNLEFMVLVYHNLKSYDNKLIERSHFICDSIARKLYGIDFKNIKKIAIDLIKNRDKELLLYNEQVLLFKSNLSFFDTSLNQLYESPNEVVRVVQRVLECIADEYQLDKLKIQEVLKQCYDGGYAYSFYGPVVYSFSRENYAKIACYHTAEKIDIDLVVFESSSNKELFRKHLYTRGSSLSQYYYYLGKLNYQEKGNMFVYSSKTGGKISVSIDHPEEFNDSRDKEEKADEVNKIEKFIKSIFKKK